MIKILSNKSPPRNFSGRMCQTRVYLVLCYDTGREATEAQPRRETSSLCTRRQTPVFDTLSHAKMLGETPNQCKSASPLYSPVHYIITITQSTGVGWVRRAANFRVGNRTRRLVEGVARQPPHFLFGLSLRSPCLPSSLASCDQPFLPSCHSLLLPSCCLDIEYLHNATTFPSLPLRSRPGSSHNPEHLPTPATSRPGHHLRCPNRTS